MRTVLLSTLALSLLAADVLAQRQGRRGRREQSAVELENFTHVQGEFIAPSVESLEGRYTIYLPKGYDDEANAEKRYPWVIWLHGRGEDSMRFHYGAAKIVDELRGADKIPEMIIVAAYAGRSPLYFNGQRTGDYEDLITRDLKRAIEKKYRVSTKREDRAIMGISVGGFGAFRFALKHPDIFGTVATHSAAMFPADPDNLSRRYQRQAASLADVLGDPIDKKIWAEEVPSAIVADIDVKDLDGLRIYFDAGTEDRYGFAEGNSDFHEALKKSKIEHTFDLVEGGGHSWNSGLKKESLQASFIFVGKGFDKSAKKNEKK